MSATTLVILGAVISGIGEYLDDRGEAAGSVAQQAAGAVAILKDGSLDDDVQHHAEGVDDDGSERHEEILDGWPSISSRWRFRPCRR